MDCNLIRNNTLAKRIVIVNGMDRSGKMEIANVISSFKYVEKHRMDNSFDIIPKLWELGKITDDAAISFLKIEADIHLYENMISRGLNIRLDDMTSVYKYPNPNKYMLRLNMKEGDEVVDRIAKEKPIFQNTTHNTIKGLELFIKTFGKNIKIIHCIRNPVDTIYSLYKRGFGHRIGKDPREFQLAVDYNNISIPIHAIDYKERYKNLNELERIICMIESNLNKNIKSYNSLSKTEKKDIIKLLYIDSYNTNQLDSCKGLAAFLDTSITSQTKELLSKTKRNMDTIYEERKKKECIIKEKISDEFNKKLDYILKNYKL